MPLMKRIKIVDSKQGNGFNRILDDVWVRLLQLDNGYFEKFENEYDFYTNDGLLIKAVRNSDDYMAKHFEAKNNLLYVDYCEPGLGISLIEENKTIKNEFLFRNTGFYDVFGNSFYIKFHVSETSEPINIPDIWDFQADYKISDIVKIRKFLHNSIFDKPEKGELLINSESKAEKIILHFKGYYFRKLLKQMNTVFKENGLNEDTSWHSIYFGLKSAKLVKETNDFKNFE